MKKVPNLPSKTSSPSPNPSAGRAVGRSFQVNDDEDDNDAFDEEDVKEDYSSGSLDFTYYYGWWW